MYCIIFYLAAFYSQPYIKPFFAERNLLAIHYEKPLDFKLRMLLLLNGRRYEGASFGIRTLFIYANFGHKKLRPNLGLNPEITSLL